MYKTRGQLVLPAGFGAPKGIRSPHCPICKTREPPFCAPNRILNQALAKRGRKERVECAVAGFPAGVLSAGSHNHSIRKTREPPFCAPNRILNQALAKRGRKERVECAVAGFPAGVLSAGSHNHSIRKTREPPLGGSLVLAHRTGFEPATPSVGGLCSIQLSYRCISTPKIIAHSAGDFKRF